MQISATDLATITGLFQNSAFKQDLTAKKAAFSEQLQQTSITVKAGDTLSQIAQAHNLSTNQLATINQLTNPDLIYPGQVLKLTQTNPTTINTANTQTATSSANEIHSSTQATTVPKLTSQAEEEARSWIAAHESSGSYTARNGKYYGKYQLDLAYLKGDLSPANQEKTANQYVLNRYGSWVKAKEHWLSHNWY